MGIFSIVLIALVGVSLTVLVRSFRPELALPVAAITGLTIAAMILSQLTGVVELFNSIASDYGIDGAYVGVLLKIVGIAYVAQFGAGICRDAGESAAASKVEAGGRVLIVSAALPAAITALSSAASLLSSTTP